MKIFCTQLESSTFQVDLAGLKPQSPQGATLNNNSSHAAGTLLYKYLKVWYFTLAEYKHWSGSFCVFHAVNSGPKLEIIYRNKKLQLLV